MADEDKGVSHDDLDAAHDEWAADDHSAEPEVEEEVVAEEPETPEELVVIDEPETPEELEIPPEPDDNRERSNLGRRVKAMEENLNHFLNRFEQISSKIEHPAPVVSDMDDDETPPLTRADLDAYLERRETEKITRKQQVDSAYVSGYQRSQISLGMDMSEEEHTAVVQEMNTNFNVRHSDNPSIDAEKNFLRAQVSLTKKQLAQSKVPKNPLAKNTGPAAKNLGGPSDTTSDVRQKAKPKLDKYAAEFVAKTKMSDESVAAALEGETPLRLRR